MTMQNGQVTPGGAPSPAPVAAAVTYAGFWKRLAAMILDGIILSVVSLPIVGIALGPAIVSRNAALGVVGIVFLIMASFLLEWLYFALMECSTKQATLGKMALGIKVTDTAGNRISFGRATGRHFGKIVSGLILDAGFIMAAFTAKKQALHDIMADCLVVNK